MASYEKMHQRRNRRCENAGENTNEGQIVEARSLREANMHSERGNFVVA